MVSVTLIYFANYTYLLGGTRGILVKVASVSLLTVSCFMETKFYGRANIKKVGLLGVFFFIVGVSLYSNNIEILEMLCLVFVFYSAAEAEIETAIKVDMYFKSFMTVFTVFCAISGLILNRRVKGGVASYGFSHVNRLGAIILLIAIEYWIANKASRKTLVFSAALVPIEMLLHCRTGMLLMGLLFAFQIILIGLRPKDGKVSKVKIGIQKLYVVALLLIIGFIIFISYFMMVYYDNDNTIQFKMNHLLNMRLLLAHRAYQNYNIAFFGEILQFVSLDQMSETAPYFMIDNMYVYILFQWGVVLAIIYIGGQIMMAICALKKRKKLLMTVLTVCVIFSFMENQMIDASLNVPLLYFGLLLKNGRKELCK